MSHNLLKTLTFVRTNILQKFPVNCNTRCYGITQGNITRLNNISQKLNENFKKNSILLTQQLRNVHHSHLDVNTNIINNVILWKHDGTKYMKNITIFGIFQLVVLTGFSFSVLHLIPTKNIDETYLDYLSHAYFGISVVAIPLITGIIAMILIRFYVHRSVKTIILNRGGKNITLITYHMWKGATSKVVPVDDIVIRRSRSEVKNYMPLNIKSTRLYHLLDGNGVFVNPDLFDHTIGYDKEKAEQAARKKK
ncbi:hypothetical protein HCN44_001681 [Aphidius gifuensis]|uniref:Uncharacterized protein n=1 Tax=Aphidius gifuensis TaxID=684658 RepID=A0A834XX02_APHGI|nr:transmembrane protein 223 [Aphidius gifuensis]KAF7992356.1 hypothetical protein HCN44_001681 [Aphidius gifuensis]